MKVETSPQTRWMIRRDLPEIMAIEGLSFTSPWTEEDMLSVLRRSSVIGMVAENGEKILGFMIYDLQKTEIRMLDFAVHPMWRREGVGSELIGRIDNKLRNLHRSRAVANVQERNLETQKFLRACGWRATAVERGFYDDGQDAYVFERRAK